MQGGDAQIGAGGQLAMKQVGKGTALWLQIDPDRFNADEITYFRFTRWRRMRAVTQLLSNMGVALRDDAQVLPATSTASSVLPLTGAWQAAVTLDLHAAANAGDLKGPGISKAARVLLDGTTTITPTAQPPGEPAGFAGHDGEAVVRREMGVQASSAGKDFMLKLGPRGRLRCDLLERRTRGSHGGGEPCCVEHGAQLHRAGALGESRVQCPRRAHPGSFWQWWLYVSSGGDDTKPCRGR